jgi:hypothetical protein
VRANKKTNKIARKIILIVIALILFIALAAGYLKLTIGTRGQTLSYLSCFARGNEWWPCISPGPCGCVKEFGDGGKKCLKGKDCQSGSCFLFESNFMMPPKKHEEEVIWGECPKYDFVDHPGLTFCGSAKVDEGKITEDMRGCIY